MERASESPYLPRLALTVSFSIVLGSQIAPKMPIYLPPYASVHKLDDVMRVETFIACEEF